MVTQSNFFKNLHTLTLLGLVFMVLFLSIVFSHPLYLVSLFLGIGVLIVWADIYRQWMQYLRISLYMGFVIMLINVLVVKQGNTVIFLGPDILFIGKIIISLEALIFGLVMTLRLMIINSVFCFYNNVINPDRVLQLGGNFASKAMLAIVLAVRFFPQLLKDFERIIMVQRCRGVRFQKISRREKLMRFIKVITILFMSSLESSLQVAEVMAARGFGTGRRSYFSREKGSYVDFMIAISLVLLALFIIFISIKGWSGFQYYPCIDTILYRDVMVAVFIGIFIVMPIPIIWGWSKWQISKSKN